jgi:hypothetical protein
MAASPLAQSGVTSLQISELFGNRFLGEIRTEDKFAGTISFLRG